MLSVARRTPPYFRNSLPSSKTLQEASEDVLSVASTYLHLVSKVPYTCQRGESVFMQNIAI